MMKHIISALVENRAGVLSRTAGLFARRGFNIESLAVGETDDATVSRMTIVVEGDEKILEAAQQADRRYKGAQPGLRRDHPPGARADKG